MSLLEHFGASRELSEQPKLPLPPPVHTSASGVKTRRVFSGWSPFGQDMLHKRISIEELGPEEARLSIEFFHLPEEGTEALLKLRSGSIEKLCLIRLYSLSTVRRENAHRLIQEIIELFSDEGAGRTLKQLEQKEEFVSLSHEEWAARMRQSASEFRARLISVYEVEQEAYWKELDSAGLHPDQEHQEQPEDSELVPKDPEADSVPEEAMELESAVRQVIVDEFGPSRGYGAIYATATGVEIDEIGEEALAEELVCLLRREFPDNNVSTVTLMGEAEDDECEYIVEVDLRRPGPAPEELWAWLERERNNGAGAMLGAAKELSASEIGRGLLIERGLTHSDERVRATVAQLLADTVNPEALRQFVSRGLLDPAVDKWARAALTRSNEGKDALLRFGLQANDLQVRLASLAVVHSYCFSDAIFLTHLASLAEYDSCAEVREKAANILELTDTGSKRLPLRRLAIADLEARAIKGSYEALSELWKRAQELSGCSLSAAAALALTSRGRTLLREKGLCHPAERVREISAQALVHDESPETISGMLHQGLAAHSKIFCRLAMYAVGHSVQGICTALREGLDHPNPRVRSRALSAIFRGSPALLKKDEVKNALRERFGVIVKLSLLDPSPRVRFSARALLTACGIKGLGLLPLLTPAYVLSDVVDGALFLIKTTLAAPSAIKRLFRKSTVPS